MVDNPDRHLSQIADAGGDSVTFHVEAVDHLLLEADPGGAACSLVSGLCQAVLDAHGRGRHAVWRRQAKVGLPGQGEA
jgi:hypothetical protein